MPPRRRDAPITVLPIKVAVTADAAATRGICLNEQIAAVGGPAQAAAFAVPIRRKRMSLVC